MFMIEWVRNRLCSIRFSSCCVGACFNLCWYLLFSLFVQYKEKICRRITMHHCSLLVARRGKVKEKKRKENKEEKQRGRTIHNPSKWPPLAEPSQAKPSRSFFLPLCTDELYNTFIATSQSLSQSIKQCNNRQDTIRKRNNLYTLTHANKQQQRDDYIGRHHAAFFFFFFKKDYRT